MPACLARSSAVLSHAMTSHSSPCWGNLAMYRIPSPTTDALGRAPPNVPVPASRRILIADRLAEPDESSPATRSAARNNSGSRTTLGTCADGSANSGSAADSETQSALAGEVGDAEQIVDVTDRSGGASAFLGADPPVDQPATPSIRRAVGRCTRQTVDDAAACVHRQSGVDRVSGRVGQVFRVVCEVGGDGAASAVDAGDPNVDGSRRPSRSPHPRHRSSADPFGQQLVSACTPELRPWSGSRRPDQRVETPKGTEHVEEGLECSPSDPPSRAFEASGREIPARWQTCSAVRPRSFRQVRMCSPTRSAAIRVLAGLGRRIWIPNGKYPGQDSS